MTSKYQDSIFFVFISLLVTSFQCSANNILTSYNEPIVASGDSVLLDFSKYEKCGRYIINDTIDLQWKTLYLPKDLCVVLNKGLFKNGCIVGNNTQLKYKNAVFDKVIVKGTWIVPHITTAMFKDLTYDNSLKDVFALANQDIPNRIHIEDGIYQVTATDSISNCLRIGSNTDLVIDGKIALTPNGLTRYSILYLTGKNINIRGKGCVIGEKPNHKGKEGEWGMGINIVGGENINISGLTIRDCWGDCIYIRRKSKNIRIENCVLDNGRRQGISIISAQDVLVKNCKITNIGGTNPAYGIDVEPNQGDKVGGVKIVNVEVNNCRGGFECNGHAKDALIEDISIKYCTVSNTKKWPLRFLHAGTINIEKCKVNGYKAFDVIVLNDVNKASVDGIAIDGSKIKRMEDLQKSLSLDNVKQLRIK